MSAAQFTDGFVDSFYHIVASQNGLAQQEIVSFDVIPVETQLNQKKLASKAISPSSC
jgi:hypothetical protein